MVVKQTKLKGCFILEPKVFEDERGYFFETFNQNIFHRKTGLMINFVQDNESKSSKGVLRGLHYQLGDFAQAKLVRVTKGKVLDVAVDVRPNSASYGDYVSVVLSENNKKQLFIPRGFAHGFLTLEDDTIFNYKCDNFYNKASESGILYCDEDLNIDWNFPLDELIISEKDLLNPRLKNAVL